MTRAALLLLALAGCHAGGTAGADADAALDGEADAAAYSCPMTVAAACAAPDSGLNNLHCDTRFDEAVRDPAFCGGVYGGFFGAVDCGEYQVLQSFIQPCGDDPGGGEVVQYYYARVTGALMAVLSYQDAFPVTCIGGPSIFVDPNPSCQQDGAYLDASPQCDFDAAPACVDGG